MGHQIQRRLCEPPHQLLSLDDWLQLRVNPRRSTEERGRSFSLRVASCARRSAPRLRLLIC